MEVSLFLVFVYKLGLFSTLLWISSLVLGLFLLEFVFFFLRLSNISFVVRFSYSIDLLRFSKFFWTLSDDLFKSWFFLLKNFWTGFLQNWLNVRLSTL